MTLKLLAVFQKSFTTQRDQGWVQEHLHMLYSKTFTSFWKAHFFIMAEVWCDGHFIRWQLHLRRVVLFLPSFLSTEQLQEKGGRVTEMWVWRRPWRSFSLISHSKLYQVGCGFVQPTLPKNGETAAVWVPFPTWHCPPVKTFFLMSYPNPTTCIHCTLLCPLLLPGRAWLCCLCNSLPCSCQLEFAQPSVSFSPD